jgi:hypothetical protein
MDNESYHADFSSISKTMLSLFLKSREEYYRTYLTGEMQAKRPSKVMQLGTLGHAISAEGKKLHQLAVVYPDDCLQSDGKLHSQKSAKFRADCAGYVCLKRDEYDDIKAATDTIFANEALAKLIENATAKEEAYFAELEGLKVKCKPDILCDLDEAVWLFDLKFSSEIDPRSFRASSRRFMYPLQDAHYSAVVKELFGKPVIFRFCCIETKFPYRIQFYWYEQSQRENVAGIHRQHLRNLAECYKTGNWKDDWKPEVEISPWEMGDTDEMEVPFDFDADNASDDVQF